MKSWSFITTVRTQRTEVTVWLVNSHLQYTPSCYFVSHVSFLLTFPYLSAPLLHSYLETINSSNDTGNHTITCCTNLHPDSLINTTESWNTSPEDVKGCHWIPTRNFKQNTSVDLKYRFTSLHIPSHPFRSPHIQWQLLLLIQCAARLTHNTL